jgi:hypothetical protein
LTDPPLAQLAWSQAGQRVRQDPSVQPTLDDRDALIYVDKHARQQTPKTLGDLVTGTLTS